MNSVFLDSPTTRGLSKLHLPTKEALIQILIVDLFQV